MAFFLFSHKEENTLDKLIAELLGRVDTMCVKETKNRRFVDSDDSLDETEKKISDISMEISAFEKECHMQNVEKNCVLPKAKLSMTVATSTDVRGKAEQTQAETQTDKESGSDDVSRDNIPWRGGRGRGWPGGRPPGTGCPLPAAPSSCNRLVQLTVC